MKHMEPEIREPVPSKHALVPVAPPRASRVQGWLQRVTGLVARRPPAPAVLPPDWKDVILRTEALEHGLAAQREETLKRLEQSESRTLHHVQQRFEALEAELGATLRKAVENEVGVATGSLRRWLVGAILLAGLAVCAAALALYELFSRS
jgi:hypothetical protein